MLEFTVNGKGMGEELRVDAGTSLNIEASATINPVIDLLNRIELYHQGEVVAQATSNNGSTHLQLKHKIKAEHGAWFVLRAYGRRQQPSNTTVALSAPIYVRVDGKGFCLPSRVQSIVADLKDRISQAANFSAPEEFEEELHATYEPTRKYWPSNKALLLKRVEKLIPIYEEMIERAKKGSCLGDKNLNPKKGAG